jgi:hypothetical protein
VQTTVFLIELLIIGGELALLLGGIFVLYFGGDLQALKVEKELYTVAAVVVAVALYPLGIVWNRASDACFSALDKRLKNEAFQPAEDTSSAYHNALAAILLSESPLSAQLGQVRSTYRIARATGLSALLGALVMLPRAVASDGGATAWVPILLLALFGCGSVQCWFHLRKHYLEYVKQAHRVLASDRHQAANAPLA